jgi:hypothetical protein
VGLSDDEVLANQDAWRVMAHRFHAEWGRAAFEVLMRRPPRNSHKANVILDHCVLSFALYYVRRGIAAKDLMPDFVRWSL